MNFPLNNRFQFDVGVIFFASLVLTLPFYFWGIPGGADMPQHYQFAQTFYDSIANGTIYPSWSANTNWGYGEVGIRFYPPLTYYFLSFFRFLTGNWYEASCLMFAFCFFVGGLGVYKWARDMCGENSALAGALIYLIAPYHLFQIYQAFLLAEFAAAAILPFCFLYGARVCRNGNFSDVCRLALSFGLLILTHLPTTVMASIALNIYLVWSLRRKDFIQQILKLSTAAIFSLLLTGFYWVRMLTELDWVKHNTPIYSSGKFSYQTNFAFTFFGEIFGVELTADKTFLNRMILVTLGILIPSLIAHFINSKEKNERPAWNLLAMSAFSLLMTLPLSLPVWNLFPVLQKIQFPWRWLIFVSLGTAIFAAFSFQTLVSFYRTSRRSLSILAAGLLLICLFYNGLWVMNHLFYIPKDFFTGMTERLKTAKTNDCWWTIWMPSAVSEESGMVESKFEPLSQKIVAGERNFEIKSWTATERVFVIDNGETGQAEIATMYYPYWKASVNAENVQVTPTESGLISFPISKEKSEVRLYFEEPAFVIIAFYISGVAWIIFLVLLAASAKKSAPDKP